MNDAAGAAPVFAVRDLHYAYHGVAALNGLSADLPAGRRIALIGANGSGKSTLLKLLAALYFADSGAIRAFGKELTEAAMQDRETAIAFRRRVGLVFQNPDIQLFSPTVFDELAFGPLQLGWTDERVRESIEATLKAFAIGHLRDRAPHRLSGGEKKRVALASVVIMRPEVLLLDEPTAALDPQSASAVIDLLVRESGSGRTVITATHDLDIVEDIADCCIVMQAGAIAASGPPQTILADVELLSRTRLAHAHLHAHGDGTHSHHHLHRHSHRRQDRADTGEGAGD